MTSNFIWYELLTTDVDAAQKFYGDVVGWTFQDSGQESMDYRMLMAQNVGIGGMMSIPNDPGAAAMKPCWLGYISVPDVDRAIGAITALGGKVHMPATDLPNVGRIAMLSDPQGALIYIMTPTGAGESAAYAEGVPGHCSWNELHTSDGAAGLKFYTEQFGWGNPRDMDMGPMGKYHIVSGGSGGDIGGIMTMAPDTTHPSWLYYFCVDDIAAADARVKAAGGAVVMGPHEVPGGGWMIQAIDLQGGKFALVGPKVAQS
jgi:uncharacterized protein